MNVEDLEVGRLDKMTKGKVAKLTENWIVTVVPMIFNNRLLLTSRQQWPWEYTAGWCYDKGAAAGMAAQIFDPETQFAPVGFKKTAHDVRACGERCAHDLQHECWCTRPVHHTNEPHHCDHGWR